MTTPNTTTAVTTKYLIVFEAQYDQETGELYEGDVDALCDLLVGDFPNLEVNFTDNSQSEVVINFTVEANRESELATFLQNNGYSLYKKSMSGYVAY